MAAAKKSAQNGGAEIQPLVCYFKLLTPQKNFHHQP
jgi:hypothetical protein